MNDLVGIIRDFSREINDSLDEKRLRHTENVMEKSVEMAEKYGADRDKAKLAALAHDRFRDIDDGELAKLIDKYHIGEEYKGNNALAHGPVAAGYLRDRYGIEDEDILNAVKYHTTGRRNMSLLEKIIFLADAIEKGRDYPGVDDIRKKASKGLEYGTRECLLNTVEYLEEKEKNIDKNTVDALEYYENILEGKE